MMRNRSDAYHRKAKKSAAYKLDSKCESLCEDALEILQEIIRYSFYLLTSLLEMRAVNFREGESLLPNAITLFLKPYIEESLP